MVDARSNGPLHGIRVLELSQIIAGPFCGMNLADLGADVVKLEAPGGEAGRALGGFMPGESKSFHTLNRGKRSLVVNLQDERGQRLIHRIIPQYDVFIINSRPGVAGRLSVDYKTLKRFRSDLIYMENTGYGTRGPSAERSGSDIVAQAYSGLMALDSKVDEDGAPDLIASAIADVASGISAAMGISAALFHRSLTGEGQLLNTSLLRTALSLMGGSVMREPVHDVVMRDPTLRQVNEVRARGGSWQEILDARKSGGPLRGAFRIYYGGYRAKDGAVVLGALTQANRDGMRQVLGIDENYDADPDYNAQDPETMKQADEWKRIVREKFLTRTVDEWLADFDAAGVPASPVHLPEEMADDPQVQADGMITELNHTVTGPQRVVGPIIKMSKTPTASPRAAPALGEHSDEVLSELGLSQDDIDVLCVAGVVNRREVQSPA